MSERSDSIDPERLLAQADWLRRLARRIVRDADMAEDVVQDTLVAALEHPPGVARKADGKGTDERDAGLRAWLATVARNFARRRQRAAVVRRHHEAASARREARGNKEHREAADEIELLRTQQLLTNAILKLREPYRSAVVLRYQKGLSYRALAKRLGVSSAAARKRVSRGVALLRGTLDGEHEGGRDVWCSALAVFAKRPIGAAASTVTIGGITVGTKSAWVAAAATVTLLAGWMVTRDTTTAAPAKEINAPEVVERLEPIPVEREGFASSARVALEPPEEPELAAEQAPQEPVDEKRMLRGRVIDAAGAPIAGAAVRILRDELREYSTLDLQHDKRGEPIETLQTGLDGQFGLEVAAGMPFDLEAAHTGWASSLHPGAYAGEFVEIKLQAAARFTGSVLRADGSGVPRAVIRGTRVDGSGIRVLEGTTDEGGRFLFEDLQDGPLRLQVIPEQEASLYWRSALLVAGETTEQDFTVESGYTVTGRVVDARTGEPIEGAEVGQGWTFTKIAVTDKEGLYVLPGFVTEGVYEINARAVGYGQADLDLPSARDNRITADFALPPSVSARGRLVGQDGAPIAGAYVGSISRFTDWRSARTGEDGEFLVEDLRPDVPYCLLAVAEGYGTCAFEFPRPTLNTGEYVLGEIRVRPASLLRGRLIDTTGRPLAGLAVHLQSTYDDRFALSGPLDQVIGESYVSEREGRTDHLGRFSFGDLAPGIHSIAAGPSGQTTVRSDPIHVGAGEEVAGIEIVLDAGWKISGVVVDEAGEPVPGVAVTIYPEPPTEGRMAQVFTHADGVFSADGFALGTYLITAHPTSLVEGSETRDVREVTLRGVDPFGDELRIVLPSSSLTTGIVVDSRGQAVQQAFVQAIDGEGNLLASDFTDGEGAFTLRLPPGTQVDLSAKPPPADGPFYVVDDTSDEMAATLENIAAGSTDQRLVLPLSKRP